MQEQFHRLDNNNNNNKKRNNNTANTKNEDQTPFLLESKDLHFQTIASLLDNDNKIDIVPGGFDTFFMLEHEPIYTLVRLGLNDVASPCWLDGWMDA